MRVSVIDFQVANAAYPGATVTFYTVDANGVKTATLATLYEGLSGSGTLTNPQTLDSKGKLAQPVYIDTSVIATVSGLSIADHDTGIISPAFNFRGAWVTSTIYAENDVVSITSAEDVDEGANLYLCVARHTSGTFATDRDSNSYWTLFLDVSPAADWANKVDGAVNGTSEYSAKAYAIGGTGVTDTPGKGAAKEWATKAEDNTVDGSEYSAKHYAAKAEDFRDEAQAAASGFRRKENAKAASTGNLTLSGEQTVDDIALVAGDRVLAKDQSDASENGIYIVAAGAWSRAADLDTWEEVPNATVAVEQGTVNADKFFQSISDSGGTLDATDIDWSQTGGGDMVGSNNLSDVSNAATARTNLGIDGSSGNIATGDLADNGVTPAKVSGSVNAQTGTTYTAALTDAFKTVTMDNASANTFTIPANAAVAFAVGDRIDVVMLGAGVTTIEGDTGVTVNGVSAGSGDLARYGAASLLKIATNEWLVIGLTVS